jgi:HEPN domain-containing protein
METFKEGAKVMNEDMDNWLKQFERKLDKANHSMELMRTCFALFTLILQVTILLKLFNII